jgi:hypothetical protein
LTVGTKDPHWLSSKREFEISIYSGFYGDLAIFGPNDRVSTLVRASKDDEVLWSNVYVDALARPETWDCSEVKVPRKYRYGQLLNIIARLPDGSFLAWSQSSVVRISDKDGSFVPNGYVRRMDAAEAIEVKQRVSREMKSDPDYPAQVQIWRQGKNH